MSPTLSKIKFPPVKVSVPIVHPPIVPPSNKTEEPVTSPQTLTLKFEDDIKNPLSVVTDELIKKVFLQ